MNRRESTRIRTGGCLCEGVRYKTVGTLRAVTNCFCGQCQKTSGHHFAATEAQLSQFELINHATLSWYPSSNRAKRGFCNRCGSSLFWQKNESPAISITAGTLDKPTGLETTRNIFVADKSDYHDLPVLK